MAAATTWWAPTLTKRGESEFIGARLGTHEEYVVLGVLPTSGNSVGILWRAQGQDGRIVLVKTAQHPESGEWEREIRGDLFAQSIPHRNLMTVHQVSSAVCPLNTASGQHKVGPPGAVLSYAVLELCSELDMFSYCRRHPFSPELARHYFVQLVQGIHHLHQHKGAHRDIKPENLLLSRDLTLKIGDFGFARSTEGVGEFTVGCGTVQFNSPEMSKFSAGYSSDIDPMAQDVWMMGCCLFTLLTSTFPFEGLTLTRKKMFELLDAADGVHPPTHKGYWNGKVLLASSRRPQELARRFLNPDVIDLLNRMWDRDHKRRITTEQILQHRWVTHNTDGTPYLPYDMAAAADAVMAGGEPVAGSLLAEMCSKHPPGVLTRVLRGEENVLPKGHQKAAGVGDLLRDMFAPEKRAMLYGMFKSGAKLFF